MFMRKAALLATALAFIGSDLALAAPVPASAAKTVVSNSDQDLTLVRRKKRRAVRRSTTTTTPSAGAAPMTSAPATTPAPATTGSGLRGTRPGGGR
jgi:hypothetical protein